MDYVIKGLICVVLAGCLYFGSKFIKAKQTQRENKMLETYMQSLQIFCEEIQKRVEVTRRYRHDLKGYIKTLEALLEAESDNIAIRQYVKEQENMQLQLKQYEYCSDDLINTIIQMKQEECGQKGIPFEFCIGSGDYSGMDEMDKVCLLINLLDNAIEATERLKMERSSKISLKMELEQEQLRIRVENAISQKEEFSFQTRKVDKRNHGLGTAIIQQVLDKYKGVRNTRIDLEQHLLHDELILQLK